MYVCNLNVCVWMHLSWIFTLTDLPVYGWILFQKQELFIMSVKKSKSILLIHICVYIHTYVK